MCCILHKPAGVTMPNLRILESMYLHNRDGIGFCTSSGKSWHGMSFYRFLAELGKTDDSEEIIIHMRWATHGSVNVKNCHPFYDKEHNIWFAHNGVLPIRATKDRTDSETFFRDRFIPMLDAHDYDSSRELWDWVNVERGSSRFIFMRDGKVKRLGNWYEFDGCYFSNMNWQY